MVPAHRARRHHRESQDPPGSVRTSAACRRSPASIPCPNEVHVLFPTIDFAIFFAVVFTVQWLLVPYRRAVEGVHGAGELRVLRVVGLALHLPARRLDGHRLRRRPPGPPGDRDLGGRWRCGSTLALLLGLLAWFKYYGFVAVNVDNVTHFLGLGRPIPLLTVTLPVGISFFTFMAISYVVDIYRGVLRPARGIDVTVYLSFFPHLIAGPIVRGTELLPQIRTMRDPESTSTTSRRSG